MAGVTGTAFDDRGTGREASLTGKSPHVGEATARVERRLAAILAADVVGYSRLVERDERGTLERIKTFRRELLEPLLAEHRGRIIKLMGDGALCEFASVVDAVACAVAIQRGMAERETEYPRRNASASASASTSATWSATRTATSTATG